MLLGLFLFIVIQYRTSRIKLLYFYWFCFKKTASCRNKGAECRLIKELNGSLDQ